MPPTTAQQKGQAFAPMPFAAISFVSSSFVIYHLVFQAPQKRKRLYHRLVLAMNFALLLWSANQFWGGLAVPEGTPNYAGAMGTQNTCTVQGFVALMMPPTVATYYGSLALQAFLGMRNNFKEEKYRWIEFPIHLVAYCIPCALAIVPAATENINPSGSGCYSVKAPLGCDSDPDVECQRGQDLGLYGLIVLLYHIILYLIFPPLVILIIDCWMKKTLKEGARRASGMTIVREQARKEMMRSVHRQTSVFLFAFWSTWLLPLINMLYWVLTGITLYNLNILANCILALQGFVLTVVYFTLQKMSRGPKVDSFINDSVSIIRGNAQRKMAKGEEEPETTNGSRERFSFNVFEGEPDPDSPWAKFFEEDDRSDGDVPDEGEQQ